MDLTPADTLALPPYTASDIHIRSGDLSINALIEKNVLLILAFARH